MDEVNKILASKEAAPSPLPPPPPPPPPLPPPLLLLLSSSSFNYKSESAKTVASYPPLAKSCDVYNVPSSESKDSRDKGPRLSRLGSVKKTIALLSDPRPPPLPTAAAVAAGLPTPA
ncbi:hypothetical protein V2W45_1344643 [Cenococcum geophilum]